MAKRATATNWEIVTRDDKGAMVISTSTAPIVDTLLASLFLWVQAVLAAWTAVGKLTRFALCAIRMSLSSVINL